jgi:hypothetical protein
MGESALDRQGIIRQVEHYLSLSNLATDNFLRAHMQASASGVSVPLSVLAGFPRLRALCPADGEDGRQREELIAAVLQDSQASCLHRSVPDACGAFFAACFWRSLARLAACNRSRCRRWSLKGSMFADETLCCPPKRPSTIVR